MTSYLAPHECFNTTFMRTWNHDTRAVCIFMFLQRKKQTNHKLTLTLKLKRTYLQRKASYNNLKKKQHTRFFFNVYPTCAELQNCNCSNISFCFRQTSWYSEAKIWVFLCFPTQNKSICFPFYCFYLEQWNNNKIQVFLPKNYSQKWASLRASRTNTDVLFSKGIQCMEKLFRNVHCPLSENLSFLCMDIPLQFFSNFDSQTSDTKSHCYTPEVQIDVEILSWCWAGILIWT